MNLDIGKLMGMAAQAAPLFGKGKGVGNMAANAAKLFSAFQKYPKTMDGLQQALNDYGIDSEKAGGVLASLSPEQRSFLDKQFPGSLGLLEEKVVGHVAASTPGGVPAQPSTPAPNGQTSGHSERLQELLRRSKPLR